MDEDYKDLLENINVIDNLDQDKDTKCLIFKYFLKGIEIGLSKENIDFRKIFKLVYLNV